MENINLHTWRDDKKAEQVKRFQTVAAVIFLATCGFNYYLYTVKNNEIGNQNNRITYIKQQIEEMKGTAEDIQSILEKKQVLIDKINVINKLQVDRPVIVFMLDELVSSIPSDAFLTKLNREGKNLIIEGYALNNDSIAEFMRSLDNKKSFTNPNIISVKIYKQEGYVDSSAFKISVTRAEAEAAEGNQ